MKREIELVQSVDDRITGYYVVDRNVTSKGPGEWAWNDRGNGPEIITDGVEGPFYGAEALARAEAVD